MAEARTFVLPQDDPVLDPRIARLLLSVAPLVKTISPGSAPIARATCLRAFSTASAAFLPARWTLLAGLAKVSRKYGSMASSTRGSQGVDAW